MKKDQIFVAMIIGFLMTLMVTSAQAGTTIKNIIDTETGLLIGQTWTDNESGNTDYVYVDKSDRQLFVHNKNRYKELVRKKVVGETTQMVRIHMGDAKPMEMAAVTFIELSGENNMVSAILKWNAIQDGDQGGSAGDDHIIEQYSVTPVERSSELKLTQRQADKLNSKIKQYKESE